jgi:hypothetical protein
MLAAQKAADNLDIGWSVVEELEDFDPDNGDWNTEGNKEARDLLAESIENDTRLQRPKSYAKRRWEADAEFQKVLKNGQELHPKTFDKLRAGRMLYTYMTARTPEGPFTYVLYYDHMGKKHGLYAAGRPFKQSSMPDPDGSKRVRKGAEPDIRPTLAETLLSNHAEHGVVGNHFRIDYAWAGRFHPDDSPGETHWPRARVGPKDLPKPKGVLVTKVETARGPTERRLASWDVKTVQQVLTRNPNYQSDWINLLLYHDGDVKVKEAEQASPKGGAGDKRKGKRS